MDCAVLQESITLLEDWSITNHLSFNVSKCKYMIISRKNSPTEPLYHLGDPIQKWSATNTCAYTFQVICHGRCISLQLVLRPNRSSVCLTGAASPDTLKQLHLSMIRPHLDYACLTLLKTRKYWRTCKSLPLGWHLTNGILAIRTYYNCINYHPWRSVGCTKNVQDHTQPPLLS